MSKFVLVDSIALLEELENALVPIEAEATLHRLANSTQTSLCPSIAIDMEGANLSRLGSLTLICVGIKNSYNDISAHAVGAKKNIDEIMQKSTTVIDRMSMKTSVTMPSTIVANNNSSSTIGSGIATEASNNNKNICKRVVDCTVYALDMMCTSCDERQCPFHERLRGVLVRILENSQIEKIIHDCRKDSDALFHHWNIKIVNVFDTSVWDWALSTHHASLRKGNNNNKGAVPELNRKSLNNACSHYNCEMNIHRTDSRIKYNDNPLYWEQRPITADMLSCACCDVSVLFSLRDSIYDSTIGMFDSRATVSPERISSEEFILNTQRLCEEALEEVRDLRYASIVVVPRDKIGLVIGKQGSAIKAICKKTNAKNYNYHHDENCGIMIFCNSQKDMEETKKAVKRRINIGQRNDTQNNRNGKSTGQRKKSEIETEH